jgi:signal transduction histidine kinase
MPLSTLSERLFARLPQWRGAILIALLACLFWLLLQPLDRLVAPPLVLAQVGLFILWQPLIEGRQRVSTPALLLLCGAGIFAAFQLSAWMLMFWILLLAGIVGGKVLLLGRQATRLFHLFALGFLVLALLALATPLALPAAKLPEVVTTAVKFILLVMLVVMLVLPRPDETGTQTEVLDFVNSLFVFLLLAVLVLGSVSMMLLAKTDYVTALLQSLIALGAILLVLGWTWSPHAGFAGWGNFFSRYLLTIGMPAEQWLHSLADLAERELEPDTFVAEACSAMTVGLPWVSGIKWSAAGAVGSIGEQRGASTHFDHQEVHLTLYTHYPLPPSLVWHFNLLVQLLGEFHADKQREQRLKELSYLQAVHETGARLTHDVKNLLQSLQMLCHAANEPGADDSVAFRALLRRQLPAIATRLEVTLDKLRLRQETTNEPKVSLLAWWDELKRRFEDKPWIQWKQNSTGNTMIPGALFTSVADNLLANTASKRQRESSLTVEVEIENGSDGAVFRVSDSGTSIDSTLESKLLRGPVSSEDGLGIGLYQAMRQAELHSYQLVLERNRDGCVCFCLSPTDTLMSKGNKAHAS